MDQRKERGKFSHIFEWLQGLTERPQEEMIGDTCCLDTPCVLMHLLGSLSSASCISHAQSRDKDLAEELHVELASISIFCVPTNRSLYPLWGIQVRC